MWGSHQGASEYSTTWGALAANEVAFQHVKTDSKRNPD
jgi:hypothetical protein